MFRSYLLKGLRSPAIRYSVPKTTLPSLRTSVFQKPEFVRFYAGFPALTRDIARERIVEILEGYDRVKADSEITESTSFTQDLGLDSLDVVELVMEMEHEFNIQIPDQEADGIKTVGQAVNYILAQPDAC
ncbi:Piso0_001804 [Millerozyma farinosa CBS 7064]|uniref:Acyl carrier protein n=1 Tax=Pichia sorbitophila (strain ATCC MYA-4447 / BCRC 22081 / CBS 7064 / NBRC 10061 / NRRL Y-12695) TaxID=559304 RepID=G8YLS3_PICSO|nr:Piso0_001804 [Millerozyma farinosa CBS 7064]